MLGTLALDGRPDPAQVTQALLEAFAARDRDAAERLIAPDFHVTSPLDNRIDRATCFATCWPGGAGITGFEVRHLLEDGNVAMVTYLGSSRDGAKSRHGPPRSSPAATVR
jgi:hypothetical protein